MSKLEGTTFRLIDLIHHHRLGDLYFARLPRYGDVIYYSVFNQDWCYNTSCLKELFRVTRIYLEYCR